MVSIDTYNACVDFPIFEPYYKLSKAQKDWLERLRKQLILNHDEIIDRARINELFEQSREYRGAKGVDLLLKNQLEPLLEEINEALWEKVS